jgi:hypothetical protein
MTQSKDKTMTSVTLPNRPEATLGAYRFTIVNALVSNLDSVDAVRIAHFEPQIEAAYAVEEPVEAVVEQLKGELFAWDETDECSFHADPTQPDNTLAPYFFIVLTSRSSEDYQGNGQVEVSVLPVDDEALHGDACRRLAALYELHERLTSDFGAYSSGEPDLDLSWLGVVVPPELFDELPQWPAYLEAGGWDVEANGDRFENANKKV